MFGFASSSWHNKYFLYSNTCLMGMTVIYSVLLHAWHALITNKTSSRYIIKTYHYPFFFHGFQISSLFAPSFVTKASVFHTEDSTRSRYCNAPKLTFNAKLKKKKQTKTMGQSGRIRTLKRCIVLLSRLITRQQSNALWKATKYS